MKGHGITNLEGHGVLSSLQSFVRLTVVDVPDDVFDDIWELDFTDDDILIVSNPTIPATSITLNFNDENILFQENN